MMQLSRDLYVYCTDFVINLANIFELSYYEINAIIFCIIYPAFIFGFFFLFLIQKQRLKMITHQKKCHLTD